MFSAEAKQFTTYELVEFIEKKTGMKYSEPHAHCLLRSLGFSAKRIPKIADHAPPSEELEIWQKDVEKEVETLENDGLTLVMADESH